MKAATPTPSNPVTAWVMGRFRAIRRAAMRTAAATAAPIPQPSPPMTLATMNTTTGNPESSMPIGPPICCQMVGTALSVGAAALAGAAALGGAAAVAGAAALTGEALWPAGAGAPAAAGGSVETLGLGCTERLTDDGPSAAARSDKL